ncbi:Sodium-coupled monocarboxylate transporter 1, partial [Stegodyphus mimosarum]
MDVEKAVLGTVDYILFALMLLISAAIGIYFRFSGGKQKTTDEYLLAGKNMAILPVAFSLMASFLSAITVIGMPAEMYRFGLYLAYLNVGFAVGTVLSAYVSVPVFFEMQASTAYEYLERRFGKCARTFCSLAFVVQMILYMSVVLYAPALALSAVTNLSTWLSVISIGVVCTFYCTLGGMKAVLWTDVFQALLMYLGIFAVLIKGIIDLGGVSNVYRIANEGGRLTIPGFEVDPEVRYTVWNLLMQGIILSMSAFGGNQVQIQRLLTVKNLSRSRTALYVSIPMGVSFHLLNCLAGIVIYANFYNCDPMTAPNKPISSADQLMPYYIMSALGQYPGLPGVCICGIFSASLSTVSSAVNSLAAVTMEDLVRPFFVARGYSQKKMAFSAKAI